MLRRFLLASWVDIFQLCQDIFQIKSRFYIYILTLELGHIFLNFSFESIHIPFNANGCHGQDWGHYGQVGHEVGHPAEVGAIDPVSAKDWIKKKALFGLSMNANLVQEYEYILSMYYVYPSIFC